MRRSGKLNVIRVPVSELSSAAVDSIWRLYDGHYDHVQRDVFECDLAEKSHVFIGRDQRSGEIVGFSTALIYRHRFWNRTVGVYFSGDTIIHPRYWGQRALHNAVFASLLKWKLRHPLTPLYWHLICSGFRPYLTLVRNFPHHWPHHARATPPWLAGLIDSICRERYGDAWDAERGIICFGPEQPVVKGSVAPYTANVVALPEVRFFLRTNAGHLQGDELAMIGRVDLASAVAVLRRSLRRVSRGLSGRRSMPARPSESLR